MRGLLISASILISIYAYGSMIYIFNIRNQLGVRKISIKTEFVPSAPIPLISTIFGLMVCALLIVRMGNEYYNLLFSIYIALFVLLGKHILILIIRPGIYVNGVSSIFSVVLYKDITNVEFKNIQEDESKTSVEISWKYLFSYKTMKVEIEKQQIAEFRKLMKKGRK